MHIIVSWHQYTVTLIMWLMHCCHCSTRPDPGNSYCSVST